MLLLMLTEGRFAGKARRVCRFVGLLVMLSIPASAAATDAECPALRIGSPPWWGDLSLFRTNVAPMLSYLSDSIEQPIQLAEAWSWGGFQSDAIEGGSNVVFAPPHMAELLVRRFDFSLLTVFKSAIHTVIVTKRSSAIDRLEALRGQTLAVPTRESMVAEHALTVLRERGLDARRDLVVIPVPSHAHVITNTLGASVAAGVTSTNTLEFLEPAIRSQIRVIYESDLDLHLFVLSSPKIAPACAQKLSELIIAFYETPEARPFMDLTPSYSAAPASPDDLIPYRPFTGYVESLIETSN